MFAPLFGGYALSRLRGAVFPAVWGSLPHRVPDVPHCGFYTVRLPMALALSVTVPCLWPDCKFGAFGTGCVWGGCRVLQVFRRPFADDDAADGGVFVDADDAVRP